MYDDIISEKLLNIKNLNKLYIKTKDSKIRDIIQELFIYFTVVYSTIYNNWGNDKRTLIRKLLKRHKYEAFKFLYYNFNIEEYNDYIVRYSIKYNFNAVIKLLIENGYKNYKKLFHYSVKYDNINIIEYIYQFVNKNEYINEIGKESVKYDRSDITIWAINNCANSNEIALNAIEYHNFDLLKKITEITQIDTYKAAIKSIEIDDIKIFSYLMEIGVEHYNNLAEHASNYGRLKMLKIIPDEKYNKDTIASIAAEYGHLNIIKWLYKNGYRNINNIVLSSAKGNNINIIVWGIKKGFNNMYALAIIATENGNLEIVKYAYDKGSNNIEEIMNVAALNDYPNIVEWALDNGAKDIDNVKRIAKIYGYNDLIDIVNKY